MREENFLNEKLLVKNESGLWPVEEDPGFLVADVARMLRVAFEREIEETGLTRAQWRTLAYLYRDDGLTQTQLAKSLDVERASVGDVIDRLVSTNLVERQSSKTDRRVRKVFLTNKARTLIPKLFETAGSVYERTFGQLIEKDFQIMMSSLQSARKILRTLADDK